jgi:hypothetical protein
MPPTPDLESGGGFFDKFQSKSIILRESVFCILQNIKQTKLLKPTETRSSLLDGLLNEEWNN